MTSNLIESKQYTGRYWECPICAKKIYPPKEGEVRQPVSLRGSCSHNICMRCIITTAGAVQLKKAIDTGKQLEVHCPIAFGGEGGGCGGIFLIDGKEWGVSGGDIYHRVIEWYDGNGK